MDWKFEKAPFGLIEMSVKSDGMQAFIEWRLNGSQWYKAFVLDGLHKAMVLGFGAPKINGKKVVGFVLPDFEGVKAAMDAVKAEIAKAKQDALDAEITAYKSGEKPIKLPWLDGEYYSGHTVHNPAADLLVALGLASYLDGWGYAVDIKGLPAGMDAEISYPQAVEIARPAQEAAAKAKAKEEERIAQVFALAKKTGKPQVLASWMEDCNDPNADCSQDDVTKYAMPDGRTKIERCHTW